MLIFSVKTNHTIAFAAVFIAGLLFCGIGFAHADTIVSSDITSDTTWTTAGGVYIVANNISIQPGVTLTIDPGVVIKFSDPYFSTIVVNGMLEAVGSPSSPIYFTSYQDDIGGDTNGDGASTLPAAGDWAQIRINSGGSATFGYAVVRYGGIVYGSFGANIYNNGGTLTVASSTVAWAYYGIRQNDGIAALENLTAASSTYGLYAAGGALVVHDSFFVGNSIAAYLGNLTSFSGEGNRAWGNTDYNGFFLASTIYYDMTWGPGMPYIINFFSVPLGVTLTLQPGVVVKFLDPYSYMDISGALEAEGTSDRGIFFTSFKDDLIGGDTNGDATSTSPETADWKQIRMRNSGSATFKHAVVRYGGNGYGGGSGANIYSDGGTLSIATSTIAYGSAYGILQSGGTASVSSSDIAFNGQYGFYLSGGTVSITGTSTIHDNSVFGAYNGTGATSSFSAVGNYWGDSSGPFNPWLNPYGHGDAVSNYIAFSPWVGTSTLRFVIDENCHSSGYCGSVPNGSSILLLDASTTPYVPETNAATSTWNALNKIFIATPTSTPPNVAIYATSAPDVAWKGRWSPAAVQPDSLYLNTYYLDSRASAEIQNTITHELGHALGLDHSFTGNVMYFLQSSQTSLGPQDLSDFNYLWP